MNYLPFYKNQSVFALPIAFLLSGFLLTGCLGSSSSSDSGNDDPAEEVPDEDNGDSGSGEDDDEDDDDEQEDEGDELLTELTHAYTNSNLDLDDRPLSMQGVTRAGDQLLVNDGPGSVALVNPESGELQKLDIDNDTAGGVRDLSQGTGRWNLTTDDVHYFTSNEDDLWRSDGTAEGTYRVASVNDSSLGPAGYHAFVETAEGPVIQADTSKRDGDCFFRVVPDADDGHDTLVSQCGVTPDRLLNVGPNIVLHNGRIHYSQAVGSDPDLISDWNVDAMDPAQIAEGTPNTERVWSLPNEEGNAERSGPFTMASSGGALYMAANGGDGPTLHTPSGTSSSRQVFSPSVADEVARTVSGLVEVSGTTIFFTRIYNEDLGGGFGDFPTLTTPVRTSGSGFTASSLPSTPDQEPDWRRFERQQVANALQSSDIREPVFKDHLLLPVDPVGRPFDRAQWWTISSGGQLSAMESGAGGPIELSSPINAIAAEADGALYLVGEHPEGHPEEFKTFLFRFTSGAGAGEPIDISDTVNSVAALATIDDKVFILGSGTSGSDGRRLWRLND
ncbi:MAG: hypothetical protein EA349_02045 [Halomonadaceae bacterium]|nr:MAG: hypothetical protein EA349_02045 [Halomonadaceae bacterium]